MPSAFFAPLFLPDLAATLSLWGVIWIFASVPLHDRLSRGFDPAALSRLVGTNRLRTAFWTGHAVIVLVQVWRLLPKP